MLCAPTHRINILLCNLRYRRLSLVKHNTVTAAAEDNQDEIFITSRKLAAVGTVLLTFTIVINHLNESDVLDMPRRSVGEKNKKTLCAVVDNDDGTRIVVFCVPLPTPPRPYGVRVLVIILKKTSPLFPQSPQSFDHLTRHKRSYVT